MNTAFYRFPSKIILFSCLAILPHQLLYAEYETGLGAPDPLITQDLVGVETKGWWAGAGIPENNQPILAARDGAIPPNINPLPVDIFSSKDFYVDKHLWFDPLYYRCNSPSGLEQLWGAYEVPIVGTNPPATIAWGYCDRDYPRKEILSPYPFTSASSHYEALLTLNKADRGPNQHTQIDLTKWSGRYDRHREKNANWFHGANLQVPTYLSLLTPEYQQRFVQQMYHYAATNAPQWPGSYCWPEGFMRRFAQYGGGSMNFVVTPEYVLDIRNAAKTLMTQIHIGRTFNTQGKTPRLGPDVPEWFGETVGFWTKDSLITWTSNIQGWISHGGFEYSNRLQSIEIYTSVVNSEGEHQGLRHEAILYDNEAFVAPLRIVNYFTKTSLLNEGDPMVYMECQAANFPIEGETTPKTPGSELRYFMPNIPGRPWADIWEKYYEQHMQRPSEEDIFSFE